MRSAHDLAPLAGVTGASGFIGRHVVAALADAGWRVRLLLRRRVEPDLWPGVVPEVVAGDLADTPALARLVDGASAVVHVAGLIKAARRSHFFAVNREGAARLAAAARDRAPNAHVVLLSSLAAREPQLSDYAASKRAGEEAMQDALGARLTVLRPPVVYGPADRETLLFFRLASRRTVPLLGPPASRAALLHVADLSRLVVALAEARPTGAVVAAADGRPSGYGWQELLATAAGAVGNANPRFRQVPQTLLGAVARVGDAARVFGSATMLGSQKLRELRHPDWSVAPAELAQPAGWTPRFDLAQGFADAVAWYRGAGWLGPPPR